MGVKDFTEYNENQPLLAHKRKGHGSISDYSVEFTSKPAEEKSKCYKVNVPEWLSSSFIMTNIIVGIGLLNFPKAYSDAGGLPVAITIQLIFVTIVGIGMFLMVYAAELCGKETYHETVGHYCGPVGLIFCNIFILIHNFGACVSFLVILADQLDSVILFAYGTDFCHYWYFNRTFTVPIASILLVLPFCFPQKIDSFKFASFLGVVTVVYVFGLAAYKYFTLDTSQVVIPKGPETWTDIFKVIPTICFSFEAHVESIPVYFCFKDRKVKEFAKSIVTCMSMGMVIYTLTGTFGYLTFGRSVASDLLASYDVDAEVIVASALMAIKAVMTYPVVFFCFRLVSDDLMVRFCCCYKNGVEESWWTDKRRRVVYTVIMFLVSLSIALFVPTIGSVISLLGGTAAFFVFIFPGLCLMQASHERGHKLRTVLGAALAVFGSFFAATTTVQAITRYIAGEFEETEILCES